MISEQRVADTGFKPLLINDCSPQLFIFQNVSNTSRRKWILITLEIKNALKKCIAIEQDILTDEGEGRTASARDPDVIKALKLGPQGIEFIKGLHLLESHGSFRILHIYVILISNSR